MQNLTKSKAQLVIGVLFTLTALCLSMKCLASDARVEAILAKMTLEEKIGQMMQLTLQAVSKEKQSATTQHQLDHGKLKQAIVDYHTGSILNAWDASFPVAHWHKVITQIQDIATQQTRLKIPILYGVDAVHGHHYMREATLFPHNLALAATWDPAHVEKSNAITAYETRASGIPWNFSPDLDIGRQPLWSRFFETFGEDPYLVSILGTAAIRGQQGDNLAAPQAVAACAKHFIGYSTPLSGRDRTPVWLPERMLRTYYLPSFKAAIKAGVATVMVNSGEVNGEPVHASHALLTGLLRDELGFNGVAVSDWEDIIKLHTVHRVAPNEKDAVRMAITAGVDMSMTPYSFSFYDHLLALVREGSISEQRIDLSVRRIVALKFRLGLFDDPYPKPAMVAKIGNQAAHQASLAAAHDAMTLLKNDDRLLPLSKQARVLVTGPGANALAPLHGAWSYTWQGTNEAVYPKSTKTLLAALRTKLGNEHVSYAPGTRYDQAIDIAAAVAAAKQADVIILAAAEEPSVEQVGSIDDLTLPQAQLELAKSLAATGKPIVLLLLENRPRIISEIEPLAQAVLLAYEPGMFGADAITDVLYGDINPSGKLPFTYPRATGALLHYDHTYAERQDTQHGWEGFQPQWPFGWGLSYTTFQYSALRVDKNTLSPNETLTASVTVKNTGQRPGKEVVQLYVRDLYASITPPMKRLRGFRKITLEPGETQQISFSLDRSDLSFVGLDNKPILEPGEFEIQIGELRTGFRVK